MSFWSLLGHRLKAYWRVPFFGRRLVSVLVGTVATIYFGGTFIFAGFFFDDLVREIAPGADPLFVAARWLLPFGLAYTVVRVMMGSGLGADPRPYLPLPIRREAFVGSLAAWALLSLWNAVPLALLVAVCAEAALSGPVGPALRLGGAGLGVLVATTYAAPILRRVVSDQPLMAAGALILAAASTGIEALDATGGIASLADASGWLLGGAVRGQVLPGVVSAVGLASLVCVYVWWLSGAIALDKREQSAAAGGSNDRLGQWVRRGPVWREAVLEGRRHLRNKQLRLTLFVTPLMVGTLAIIGYITTSLQTLTSQPVSFLLVGLFGTGFHIIQDGPNLFSYEGEQVDAFQSRPVPVQERMRGRWLFLTLGALVLFVLPLPVMLWAWSPFVLFHVAFFLYNIGVVAPLMLATSTFNRKAIDVNQQDMMASPGITVGRIVITLPVFGVPVVPLLVLSDPVWYLSLVGAVGLASAAALPLWLRGLATLYRRNRYYMMQGFRASG